jgi:hypothetical protein
MAFGIGEITLTGLNKAEMLQLKTLRSNNLSAFADFTINPETDIENYTGENSGASITFDQTSPLYAGVVSDLIDLMSAV